MCILKFESHWLDDAPNEFTIYLDRKELQKSKKKKEKEKSLSKDAKWCKDAKRGEGMKWLKHSLKPKMRS